MTIKTTTIVLLYALFVSAGPTRAEQAKVFSFGSELGRDTVAQVDTSTKYSADLGYGWMPEQPNLFALTMPEGNYEVSVTFDSPEAAASATVKAETRRLMLMQQDRINDSVRRFAVNVRRPGIDGGRWVSLNDREKNPLSPHWDELLTIEFLPDAKSVRSVTIKPATDIITVYLAGDSTVTDQPSEPWSAWGQCLPRFFDSGVAVANHAESGRALSSFRGERRFDKILSTIKKGDYLFIQFGHNDQKDRREGAGPFTTYKQDLEDFITKANEKAAHPVLVTPMERRRWSGGQPFETLSEYAEAVRQVGAKQNVPVIDLHRMSLAFYEALGETDSKRAFVHYPANTFPRQATPLKDDTHHNTYGAYELARCVVEGIRSAVPELAKHLRKDVGTFDPWHPDAPETVKILEHQNRGQASTPEGS